MRHLRGLRSGIARLSTAFGLLLAVAFLSSCGSSSKAEPILPEVTIPPEATFEEPPRPTDSVTGHPKLDSTLNQLLAAYADQGPAGAQNFAEARGLVLDGQKVEVTLIVTPDAVDRITEAVASLGGVVQGHYQQRVEALVPIDGLVSIAELAEVQQIREPQRAVP